MSNQLFNFIKRGLAEGRQIVTIVGDMMSGFGLNESQIKAIVKFHEAGKNGVFFQDTPFGGDYEAKRRMEARGYVRHAKGQNCFICGDEISNNHWLPLGQCFMCYHWLGIFEKFFVLKEEASWTYALAQNVYANADSGAVEKGFNLYSFVEGLHEGNDLGSGGRNFWFRYEQGEVTYSNSVWNNGTVPERFFPLFAQFKAEIFERDPTQVENQVDDIIAGVDNTGECDADSDDSVGFVGRGMFRTLSHREVREFRAAARKNYDPYTEIKRDIWHPIYVNECEKIDAEHSEGQCENGCPKCTPRLGVIKFITCPHCAMTVVNNVPLHEFDCPILGDNDE